MSLHLRCKSHVRVIGGIARCQLQRHHHGPHEVWLGFSPIRWETK